MRSLIPAASVSESREREFYCDLLGGTEVRVSDAGWSVGAPVFLVEGQLVELHDSGDDESVRLALKVASPLDIAERCWNAGYTVTLEGNGDDVLLHVTDPGGRRIALFPRAGAGS